MKRSSATPQSMRRRRNELRTRPTTRPALSGFGDDADAERGLVLVFGAPALLAAGELAVVDCGSSPDDRHGAKPK
jgi:hypothetical protein